MFRTLKLGGRAGVSLEEQLLEKQYRAGPRGEWPLSSGSGEPRSCAAGRWLLVAPLRVMQGPESRHQNRRLQGRATCGSPPATSCPAFCLLTPTKLMSPFSGLSALKKKKSNIIMMTVVRKSGSMSSASRRRPALAHLSGRTSVTAEPRGLREWNV